MVYLKHWSGFHSQALDLYNRSPDRTRYLVKTHPSRQWLVLKVTDDITTLKYRSRSTIILNRFDAFSREIQSLMIGSEPFVPPLPTTTTTETGLETAAAVASSATMSQGSKQLKEVTGTTGSAQSNLASPLGNGGGGGGGGGGQTKKKKKKVGKK